MNPFTEIVNLLSTLKESVKNNKGDFDDFLLTIEFIAYNYNRQNDLIVFANSGKTDLKSVEIYLKKVAAGDQIQLSKMASAWNIGRRCKPKPDDKDFMWSFNIAANYTKHLSENPSEFIRILSEKN